MNNFLIKLLIGTNAICIIYAYQNINFLICTNLLLFTYITFLNLNKIKLSTNNTLLSKLASPIMCLDEWNCISYINSSLLKKIDCNFDEIQGKHLAEVFNDSFVNKISSQLKIRNDNSNCTLLLELKIKEKILRVQCEIIKFKVSENKYHNAIILNETKIKEEVHNNFDNIKIQEYFSQLESTKAKIEQQANEIKLARDEALEATKAKSTFLATMSHEIRTPLNGVIGMSSILKESKLDQEQFELVDTIKICGETLLSLINDLLDFSKIEADKLELEPVSFNVQNILNETSQVFKYTMKKKNINFNVANKNLNKKFIGDVVRIKQILNNLISNAIKFTPENGKINLEFKILESTNNTSKVKFSVSDTGIGIPKKAIEKIFKPFEQAESSTTRKFGGTGLGLSICVKLAKAMGGCLFVESKVGKGSTFHCELLFENEDSKKNIKSLSNGKSTTTKESKITPLKILVAEDNMVNQRLMELVLKKLGHRITLVSNGEEVFKTYKENNSFDLILMDCEMPLLDGFEATRKIRELEEKTNSRIPIVAMTAHVFKGSKEKCIESGMDDYLSKPMKKDKLIEILNKIN